MQNCFFVTDLHGHTDRYGKLFATILQEQPEGVFLGGDLLPSGMVSTYQGKAIKNFTLDYLIPEFKRIKNEMGIAYPTVFLILGNDDGKAPESDILQGENAGLWEYIHARSSHFGKYTIYGYSYVPPTPFMLKDWERYDVSRYFDPGCIPPEEGWRTIDIPQNEIIHATISKDLKQIAAGADLSNAIFLFHSPPYQTNLDRAGLDGRTIDHVQVDVHVGSIAIKRFILEKQPLLTLHGHVHESAHRTGSWKDKIGNTICFSAAHGGPELALVRFDPSQPENATRELI
jgi:Icc-related predicted phosphoesterase